MQGKLHQYKIIKDLAKKYFHATYLAAPTDEPERKVVLVAFTSSLFSSPHERETVLEKAQALKKLQHPHLLPLLDMGIANEKPFVVREYLPSQSLRRRIKQLAPQRLELHDALHIVLQVGEALACAHVHTLFHGNIKPENILLDAHGQALLTDFTLLNRTDAVIRDQTTEEYAFCYQAPEQFTGTWDAHSDQYALGCLTYELITGEVPFVTQTLTSMLGSNNYTPPIPPTKKVPDLPPELASAVLKALAKDPSERFFDFSLFLEVIRSIVSPPPRFPLLRSTASYKQKTLSRFAPQPKAQPILASSHKPTPPASSLAQVFEVSSALPLKESESAENLTISAFDTLFLADQAEGTTTSEACENDAMTIALPKHIDLDTPQTRRTRQGRRKVLGPLLLFLLFASIGFYAVFSLVGTDKANQSADSTSLLNPAVTNLAGTQLSIPVSSRTTPQITSTPTPTPVPVALPLIGTAPVHAQATITVTIANLGSFQCAQVLFKDQRLGNTVTTANGSITGPVTGKGMFSVDFYPSNDCSGKRGKFARFATTTDANYTCDATQQTLCTQQAAQP
jgi:serine/threonine protein kinase